MEKDKVHMLDIMNVNIKMINKMDYVMNIMEMGYCMKNVNIKMDKFMEHCLNIMNQET